MRRDLAGLARLISEEVSAPPAPPVEALGAWLAARVPRAAAIIFYGSCLRHHEDRPLPSESVFDFYVLVDRYRDADARVLTRVSGRLLPPNLYWGEAHWEGHRLRAKYSVIRLAQFQHAARGFMPTIWGRFCQPVRLVRVRDADTRARVLEALVAAVESFVMASLPTMPLRFSPRDLWEQGLRSTYDTELRPEGPDRPSSLYGSSTARYDTITGLVLSNCAALRREGATFERSVHARGRAAARAAWALRRTLGKGLNVLRLAKAAVTFEGAVEYGLWKIERHAGVRPTISDWERRHPVMAAPLLLRRLYRLGALR